jgi:hypothetical protein
MIWLSLTGIRAAEENCNFTEVRGKIRFSLPPSKNVFTGAHISREIYSMRVKKKNIYRRPAALAAAMVLAAGCMCTCNTTGTGEMEARVKIVDIAPNDLGQVMVFADDGKGNSPAFVRSFYEPEKDQKTVIAEMRKYIAGIEKLRGRDVTVRYRKDSIGNLEIVDIR